LTYAVAMTDLTPQPAAPLPDLRAHHLSVPQSMPRRLVLIRHGESEANLITRAIRAKIITEFPPSFAQTPDREFRLSSNGREQAVKTGEWLRTQYPNGFDVIYVSDHIRAKETAGIVCNAAGWSAADIRVDPLLGERHWGDFAYLSAAEREEFLELKQRDPLHVTPPNGETLLQTRARSRILLERSVRQYAGQTVLVFSHGEFIEASWAEIQHMTTEQQRTFFHSPAGDIKNCQVVEFASVHPTAAEEGEGKLRWVRSSCPSAGLEGDWAALTPRRFTPAELLAEVQHYPHVALPPGVGP